MSIVNNETYISKLKLEQRVLKATLDKMYEKNLDQAPKPINRQNMRKVDESISSESTYHPLAHILKRCEQFEA